MTCATFDPFHSPPSAGSVCKRVDNCAHWSWFRRLRDCRGLGSHWQRNYYCVYSY